MDESGQIPYWGDNPSGRTPAGPREDYVSLAHYILAAYGHVLPESAPGEWMSASEFAGYIRRNYSLEEPRNREAYEFLTANSSLHYHKERGKITVKRILDNPPERVRAGQKFVFRRSGWDVAMREHCPDVGEGDIVRVIQLPSAPKPGTMGQVHIEDANTGEFLGMCSMKSLSTPADELEAQRRGIKRNPGDIHIDIGSHNENPPLDILSDQMVGRNRVVHYRITVPMQGTKDSERILHTLYPTWKVVSHYSLKAGAYPGVAHAYGVQMAIRHGKNPPLPASALMDVSTAKTVVREVESGDRKLSALHIADGLLDKGLQKLRGSHLGQVDWENPGPGKITRYTRRTQPLSRHNVVKAIEELITANTEIGDLLARFKRRGLISDGEYLEWKYVQQIAMMLRDDLSLATGSEMTNPPTATEIYKDIIEIRAMKPNGQRYVHKFKPGSNIYGLPNGNILIQSRKGKRLWKNFKMEG